MPEDETSRKLIELLQRPNWIRELEEQSGVNLCSGDSLERLVSAYSGNLKPLIEALRDFNGDLTIMDRLAAALALEDNLRTPGRPADPFANGDAYTAVIWLNVVHKYPKASAVERAAEIMGVTARAVRNRLNKGLPIEAKRFIDRLSESAANDPELAAKCQSELLTRYSFPPILGTNSAI